MDGKLVISGLEVEKTYYFTETKAPKGYKIPVDVNGKPIVHTLYAEAIPVENKFTFKVDDVEYNTSNTNGTVCLKGNVVDRIVSVSVTNEIMGKLPETGSSLTFMMTLTGIGLMVVSVWYYKKKNYLR